jgi:SAM-dependent methyltransferase
MTKSAPPLLLSLAIFLSAFLLFQVEPMTAKYLLPWFGGGAAVWSTCLLFFQCFLLIGYAIAHASARFLKPRWQGVIHLLLAGGAVCFLPVIPADHWKPLPGSDPVWGILLLMPVTLGLPYLVLASSSPLLQSWFALTHPGRSPYRLFALSNAGSLLALISYPLLVDPFLPRHTQSWLWAGGFVIDVLLLVGCVIVLWSSSSTPQFPPPFILSPTGDQADGNHPYSPNRLGPATVLLWIALTAVASILLLGITHTLCQETVVIPFLWILPLGLYLLSFILCFEGPAWYPRRFVMLALVPGLGLMAYALHHHGIWPLPLQIALLCGVLFLCCMACHGELYRLRPEPRRLTLYYLMIALGGALGGGLVTFVAPRVFLSYAEVPWGLCLFALLITLVHAREGTLFPTGWLPQMGNLRRLWTIWPLMAVGTLLFSAFLWDGSRRHYEGVIERSRNFYGSLSLIEVCEDDPVKRGYLLYHGATCHGGQFADPAKARLPLTYYHERSGVGLAMTHLTTKGPRRIGVIGLGTGTLAAYGKTGDTFRFYEIDPGVEKMAESRFSYLRDARTRSAKVEVIPGDARLSLEKENNQRYDLLVVDAFSGDNIPLHLLTKEAFATYLRHLAPSGVIALHLSNNYLDLLPVALGLNNHFGMQMVWIPWGEDPAHPEYSSSQWVLLTRNPSFLRQPEILHASMSPPGGKAISPILWSDDKTSILPILKWWRN